MKQNYEQIRKEKRSITSDRILANQQILSKLKDFKVQSGEMILMTIDRKTSIELPASLTKEERDVHVANFIRLHKQKI